MSDRRPAAPPSPAPFRPDPPLVIGLVGGVAAGKSAVAKMFAEHGLAVVDADAAARAAAADPEVVARLRADFGPDVAPAGQLDRSALAAKVFGDAGARNRLEAILHPPILARIDQALQQAQAAGTSALLDAPLLFETGLDARCAAVVFVAAPAEVRRARAATRGWPPGELERREAAQWDLPRKAAACRFTIDNGGDLANTRKGVAAVLRTLLAPTP